MNTYQNPLGQRFGRLVVIGAPANCRVRDKVLCQCDCGRTSTPMLHWLLKPKRPVRSCGCLVGSVRPGAKRGPGVVTHGLYKSLAYSSWRNMLNRCTNKRFDAFERYGGRGIKVCERWRDFVKFFDDMGERPTRAHSIERNDVNGNYEPGNCSWATAREQGANRRDNRLIEFGGRSMSAAEWEKTIGLPRSTVTNRLRNGRWTVGQALGFEERPVKHRTRAA